MPVTEQDRMTDRQSLEWCVEVICNKGCRAVREDMATLEQGGDVSGLEPLSDDLRQAVLAELRAIMAVYGESCRL